jgi:hypothetical protein
VAFADIDFVLKRLNTLSEVSVKVTVIVSALPESSDTNIDLITAVEKEGTVYSVVALVLVKSAFLFTKLFAIMLKRKPPLLTHLSNLFDKMCLIFVQYYQRL